MTDAPSQNQGFRGLRVVSFESRRSGDMAELIARNGGKALVAPSMREVPLGEHRDALAFGQQLQAGHVDIVLFTTAGGARALLDVLETQLPREKLYASLERVRLVARGPKPAELLRERGLTNFTAVSEPATWRETLSTLESSGSLSGKTVAIQESGAVHRELIDGLTEQGARIIEVPVYRWALPNDLAPLHEALESVIDGRADVVLFTNSTQIDHVLRVAREKGVEKEFRQALEKVVVASVGPSCTHFLDEYGLPVDVEPEQPTMNDLIEEASRQGPSILERKRISNPPPPLRGKELSDSPFMKACRRESTAYTPVWLMRQAGRYMKEYRDLRERHSFLDLCKDSDLACEVSVYAAQRLGVDAAIIFSDILLILEPMGLNLEYAKGEGPVIHNPVRQIADVDRLRPLTQPDALQFVYDAIKKTRAALPPTIPLIGFCGAPFTLASYMMEGQGSRNFIVTKSFMYQNPGAWHRLMTTIADSLIIYLNAQIAAGAQVVQLFDSWVGCLSPEDYKTYVQPHSRRVIQGVTRGTPVIHFGTQTGTFLELLRDAGGDVIGLDWRVELDHAWRRLGPVAIQGNMDPVVLFAEPAEIRRQAKRILDQAAGRVGHIFNLGHGVLPQTPVGHVKALVDAVHELSQRPDLQ